MSRNRCFFRLCSGAPRTLFVDRHVDDLLKVPLTFVSNCRVERVVRAANRVDERRERIASLGLPFEALPALLQTTESAIRKWIAGASTIEETDVIEVAVSMLEVRLARTQ